MPPRSYWPQTAAKSGRHCLLADGVPVVDRYLRTSAPHIFAAGDVTGQALVVNLDVVQGEAAGYNATYDTTRPVEDRVLPRAVFTDPQMARGWASALPRPRGGAGLDIMEVEYDLGEIGVVRTYPQEIRGFMAMRAERGSGCLIGAELVAPWSALMIHDVAVALKLHATAQDMADIPYIHPSLAEITNFTVERLACLLR